MIAPVYLIAVLQGFHRASNRFSNAVAVHLLTASTWYQKKKKSDFL